MAIAQMKKLYVAVHDSEREKLLDELQRLGVVEIEELQPDALAEDLPLLQRDAPGSELSGLEDQIGEVRYILEFFDRYAPVKRTAIEQFAGSKVPMDWGAMEQAVENLDYKGLHKECRRIDEAINDIQNQKGRWETTFEQLEPWRELDLPLDTPQETQWIRILIGSIATRGAAEFEAEIEGASPEVCWQEVAGDQDRIRLVLFVPKDDLELVRDVLARFDFLPVQFPSYSGTVAQYLEFGRREYDRLEGEEQSLIDQAKELVDRRTSLYALYDLLNLKRDRLLETGKFLRTERAVFLQGWLRDADVEKVTESLEVQLESAVFQVKDPEPEDDVPIVLENKGLAKPFEAIVHLYNLPQRHEVDPTPFIAGFFSLFFAMSLGDVGYGLMLALLCYYLLTNIRMSDLGRKTFQLLGIGGVCGMFFGLLAGSYWGDLISIPPLWFNPTEGENAIKFLLLAFVLGTIHLYVGLGIAFYSNVKRGDWASAIYDQGMWMITIAGLLLWVGAGEANVQLTQIGKWASIVGAIGLVLFQGRQNKNIFARLGAGLYSLYDVTGYASDILSYSRLLGLGMATGVIGSVINTVAFMVADSVPVIGPLVTVIILIGGHTFNLFINVIGAYVHVSRLQYVEFFGKFYEGGGRVFVPFEPQTTYVHLESTGK
ncbi:MAG: V-type ATP synthase subunit I [Limnochordia bacterium]|jgi:V/A-type H+-transporting ATPase subunit I